MENIILNKKNNPPHKTINLINNNFLINLMIYSNNNYHILVKIIEE